MPDAVRNPGEPYQSAALEWLGWTLVTVLWSLCAFAYFKLPETIPVHFDTDGNIDRYGSKLTVWLFPAIATVLYLGLTALCRYPGIFNYPVAITDENRQYQYRNAVRFLQLLKLIIVFIFLIVAWVAYRAATGTMNRAPGWLLPCIIGLVGVPAIIMVIRAFRRKDDVTQ